MSGMSDMAPTSLAAAVVPCTGKSNKNGLLVFERVFVFKLSQSSEIVLKFTHTKNGLF